MKFHKCYPGQEVILEIPEEFIMIPMDPVLIEQGIIVQAHDSALIVESQKCGGATVSFALKQEEEWNE